MVCGFFHINFLWQLNKQHVAPWVFVILTLVRRKSVFYFNIFLLYITYFLSVLQFPVSCLDVIYFSFSRSIDICSKAVHVNTWLHVMFGLSCEKEIFAPDIISVIFSSERNIIWDPYIRWEPILAWDDHKHTCQHKLCAFRPKTS